MTVTLHWWMIPLVLFVVAAVVMHRGVRKGGFLDGLLEVITALALSALALGIVAGRLLAGVK